MSMTPGTLLGPYEILAPIGEGGMGDVYRARDTRLNRIVALKTSKTEFSERFEREARAVAALNHSNICTLHDVGPNYLVMEYIEGAPLKGPLPLDQALKYAAQICDALDAAHKKGITHRDLKPANILVTKTGIKLLDFGIAKMAQTATGSEDATIRMALTGNNEMVGTLFYMSPEQLQAQGNGQPVDARSDIFSFGIVLYEMLTGKRPFVGSSPATVIAAILERPAPSVAEVAPAALDRLLQRCLAKDPDDRWQSARDLKAELEWIANSSGQTLSISSTPAPRFQKYWMAAAAMAILIVAGAWWVAYRATRPAELKPLVRLDVDLGPDVSIGSTQGASAILSPDSTRILYASKGKLFTRKLDQPKAAEMESTDGAYAPFFSPDGQWVAFFAQGKLKKISVQGGSPVILCDVSRAYGGSWGEDGTIIAALSVQGVLWKISSGGGAPTPVAELATGEVTQRWPQILPGGDAVLFTSSYSSSGFEQAMIEVISLKKGTRKTLQRGASFGRYIPTSNGAGHLTFLRNGTLFAVGFDLNELQMRGDPVQVLDGVAHSTVSASAQLDFSGTPSGPGTLLYRAGEALGGDLVTVQWMDSTGTLQPLLAKAGNYSRPSFSPDGRRLSLEVVTGSTRDIWILELQRGAVTRLTFDAGVGTAMTPVWTPDGQYIVFFGKGGLFYTRSDGGGKPLPLSVSKNPQSTMSFTPDGKKLSFSELRSNGKRDLWTMPVESDGAGLRAGKPEILLQTPSVDMRTPRFSPDGRWIAYVSNESGSYQVYIRAFPDRGGQWQISNNGGTYPIWSQHGNQLFYRSDDHRIMVVTYTVKGDSILADQPKLWSDKRLADLGQVGGGNYDLAPGGKRIAALMPAESSEVKVNQSHVVFLENFFDELRRKAPLSK